MDDTASHRDFFISRAGKDAAFAIWLGQLIAAQGKSYVLQDEHFGHQNFMGGMDAALKSGARVAGLLSQAYTESEYCLAEATAALAGDPLNRLQRLVLLRLEPCAPGGVLANIAYTDLLHERREADGRPLALKILRALGFEATRLDGLPPPPEGTLSKSLQVLHSEVQAVPGFAGRTDELDDLNEALWQKGGTAAVTNAPAAAAAVKGLGGVGKSVLAKEYAWRNRDRYQGIWWLRAERRETLADDLIELGARFIPGLSEVPDRDKAARQALDWIEQAGFAKPWLLVYDNVEEPDHIEGLTPRTGAHVLITTRWSDWGGAAPVKAAPVTVGVFPPDTAADFLLESTGRSDRESARKLAAALGHLPLALDHAAAYIRRTGIDFPTYQALAADLLQKAPKGVDYDTPVFATFSLAIDKASESCPEAQKLMGLSAFLAPDRIPLSLFTDDVLSETARIEAVAALQEVSLVTPEPLDDGSPAITMHRLVQTVMRARLAEMGEHENAAALATELVADAFPAGDPGPDDVRAWPACARLMPHAAAVFDHAPNSGNGAGKTSHLLTQTAVYYVSRAAYAEAEPLYRRALAIGEASFGPDHPSVARDLNNLARLLQDTGRLAEAEVPMRRALRIFEGPLGPEHPSTRTVRDNLAALEAELRDGATGALAEPAPVQSSTGAQAPAPPVAPQPASPSPPKAGKRGFMGGLFRRA
jgi:tetratricopeptide (TPR) repeat protein